MHNDHVPQQSRTSVELLVACKVPEEMQLEWRWRLHIIVSDLATNALAFLQRHQDFLACFHRVWRARAARIVLLLHQLVAPAVRIIYWMQESVYTTPSERSSLGLTHP